MIKAVFFDIDGTLISGTTKEIPISAREAVCRLREKGILCLVATGRSSFEIADAHLLDGLDFDGFIYNNGQLGVDRRGEVFFSTPVDPEDIGRLLDWVEQTGESCWMTDLEASLLNHSSQRAAIALDAIHTPLPPVGDLRAQSRRPIYKFALFVPPEELPMDRIPGCMAAQWHAHAHDIFSKAGGKKNALLAALKHFDLKAEETMAFGDSDNDVGMLTAAGVGVAMGQGMQAAKDAADFVTRSCDEDGILYALRHYGVR